MVPKISYRSYTYAYKKERKKIFDLQFEIINNNVSNAPKMFEKNIILLCPKQGIQWRGEQKLKVFKGMG